MKFKCLKCSAINTLEKWDNETLKSWENAITLSRTLEEYDDPNHIFHTCPTCKDCYAVVEEVENE